VLKIIDFIDDCEVNGAEKWTSRPTDSKSMKNARFSRVYIKVLWDGCDNIFEVRTKITGFGSRL
jgi:hypothetical protein